jgi:hypothetical protein
MSTTTYVMVVDGVLRKPATNAVIESGQALYWSLAETGRLALLCGDDKDKVDWFLRTNGFTKHVYLIPEDPTASPTAGGRRMQQIRELRRGQANIAFVVEPDPTIALDLYNESVPVMIYLHPTYTQPAFRPGYKSLAKPWEDLISEVEFQIEQKALNAYDHTATID